MPVSLSFPTVRFCSSGHRAIPWTRRASIAAAFRPELWRGRRIAPTREGPRNESSNRAHDSTSGRSTHYASGHLIRVFHGIGHIFSSLYPFHWRSCCLVALAPGAGLVTLRQIFVHRCQGGSGFDRERPKGLIELSRLSPIMKKGPAGAPDTPGCCRRSRCRATENQQETVGGVMTLTEGKRPRPLGAGGRAKPGPQSAERIKRTFGPSLCVWEYACRRHFFSHTFRA
jgi:hypothetical protein